jgi:hypothetical protein
VKASLSGGTSVLDGLVSVNVVEILHGLASADDAANVKLQAESEMKTELGNEVTSDVPVNVENGWRSVMHAQMSATANA